MKNVLKILLVAGMVFSGVSSVYATDQTEPLMKVKLVNYLGNQTSISLKSSIDRQISGETISLKANVLYQLKVENSLFSLYDNNNNKLLTKNTFSLNTNNDTDLLYINNRPYVGQMDFIVENGQYVRPINTVLLEDYTEGVVPNEMPASWNVEALKSQAVAARTYGWAQKGNIINDTISYQVYGGYNNNTNALTATKGTKGQVITYNGSLITAFFSSSNGGMTESNVNAWGGTQLSYFVVKNDPYDSQTPWNVTLKKQQIDLTGKDLTNPNIWWNTVSEADTIVLNNIKPYILQKGYIKGDFKVVKITNLDLKNPSSGSRVTQGDIGFDYIVQDQFDINGDVKLNHFELDNISATQIRSMLGTDKMLSYLVSNQVATDDAFSIFGKGYGHGVGMSQYGAKKMGELGKTYKDIIGFYYPTTTIQTMYTASAPTTNPVPNPVPTSPTVTPAPAPVKQGTITATNLNVRKGPSTSYSVTGYVKKGDIVIINSTNGNWLNITKGTLKGWVNASYVKIGAVTSTTAPSPNPTKSAPVKQGTITATSLNVRKGPSTNYTTVSVLKKGDVITINSINGNWLNIVKGTIKGWVNSSYVKITSTVPNTTTKTISTKTVSTKTGVIKKYDVNLRKSASWSSKSVGLVKHNSTVTILSTKGSWNYVQYKNLRGYVANQYVSKNK